MSGKSLVVALAIVVLTLPAVADVPDGHGGRTVAWKLNQSAEAASAHACCQAVVAPPAGQIVSSPAELKALGHLAWVSRKDVSTAAVPCFKRTAYRPAVFASPAERKAIGHIAARDTATTRSRVGTCCESGRCPMRLGAVASR
jgi:hypothetical protein